MWPILAADIVRRTVESANEEEQKENEQRNDSQSSWMMKRFLEQK